MLQLHTTGWLTDYWSPSDILFLRSSYGVIDFDKPLIGHTFGSTDYSMQAMAQNPTQPMLHAPTPSLFSVGTILLLELLYRARFERLKTEHEWTMVRPTQALLNAFSSEQS